VTGEEVAPQPLRPSDFLRLELRDGGWNRKELKPSLGVSVLIHVLLLTAAAFPWIHESLQDPEERVVRGTIQIRFYEDGEGPGGGGGGGGSQGRKPTAFLVGQPRPPEETPPPPERQAPVAPRRLPPLRADNLKVPDVRSDLFFDSPLSPDAVDYPGLSLTDPVDYGGIDVEKSAGRGGGLGGGQGTGVGPGRGWGVGPGEGGGFGGGRYQPGGWDIEPILREKHLPVYPPLAREKLVTGEVILEILVRIDGSTEVLRVIKSLPYGCVEAAVDAARLYRWKPARKRGKPVEAVGMLTVTFNIFQEKKGRG
jgi:protein TonB